MDENRQVQPDKEERRRQGILALLAGQPVATVCQQYHLCRSDLYKFKRRALEALREAMTDRPRGPRQPPRRLAAEQGQEVKAVCERHFSWLQKFRRISTRFDFHDENYLGFVHLGCIKILLRCYL